jgi:hypothetical protein
LRLHSPAAEVAAEAEVAGPEPLEGALAAEEVLAAQPAEQVQALVPRPEQMVLAFQHPAAARQPADRA